MKRLLSTELLSARVNLIRLPMNGCKPKRETKDESIKFRELPVSMRAEKDLENAFNRMVNALRSLFLSGANDRPSVVALVSFPDVWSRGKKNGNKNYKGNYGEENLRNKTG